MIETNYTNQFRQLIKEKDEEINKLKKENMGLKNLIAFNPEKLDFFNQDREEAIINYIKNNPGTIKSDLLKELANEYNKDKDKSYGTCATLNKSIHGLLEQNIIRLEKEHKQKHRLYLNDKSILLQINRDLNQFKDKFYHLLKLITGTKNDTIDFENYILLHIMIDVYRQVINSYINQILLKWSYEFENDNTIINKINFLVFVTLFQINLEFHKKFNLSIIFRQKAYSYKQLSSPLLRKIIQDSFILKPKLLIEFIKHYRRVNLHKEFLSLIDLVWQISSPLFSYLYINDHSDIFPLRSKELIIKSFSLLVLFCLNENDKYLDNTVIKKEKANLFGFTFISEQEKKEMKEIIIDYIKSNSNLTHEYKQLKEDYRLID